MEIDNFNNIQKGSASLNSFRRDDLTLKLGQFNCCCKLRPDLPVGQVYFSHMNLHKIGKPSVNKQYLHTHAIDK